MTTIYLIRHAEAEGNLYRRIHGWYNALVTENGFKQIEALRNRFADIQIDAVYSSPLRRSVQTAEIAINNPDLEIITDDRLIETTFGFWYGDGDENQKRINDNFNRIKSCLDDIIAKDTHTNIAIASHGGVTRALCYACGEKMGEIKNCQCFHFVLDDGKWEFVDFFDTGITVQNKSDAPK